MAVTIRDIAKKLNLSVGAVSRALDGYADISQETRHRVTAMAREMGYVPNHAARQLRRQKSDTIGYIMPVHAPRFADSFFSEFIEGLGDETASQGYDLLISTAPPLSDREKALYQQWVLGHKVDGLVLNRMMQDDWRIQFLKKHCLPFTSLENDGGCDDYPCVMVDNQSGMIQLVEHLAQQGFRRMAYIGGPAPLSIHVNRFLGLQEGLRRANLPLYNELVVESDLTSTGGYTATKRLLSIPDPPDAILCVNDETAFGAMRAIEEAGLTIGKQIAVTGFDGVRDARYSNPPLTTLDQPVYDIARQLVRMLVAVVRGQPVTDLRVVIQPTLLIRASSGDKSPATS